ncbi:MAG: glycosyltransferase family protein [Nitratireductor sp.]
MKTLAILQARMSSSRLPGKVGKDIFGKPMLARQLERLLRAETIEKLVVATSTNPEDDAIAAIAASLGVDCFRGSLDDVLDRFYQCARQYDPQSIVRLTGDCPLADWRIVDNIVEFAISGGFDYASNGKPPTFPDGLDVEVVRFDALETAWREAELKSDREHVLPFIHRQDKRFSIGNFRNDEDLSDLRWTVDEPADLEFVRAIYGELHDRNPDFSFHDILHLIAGKPELSAINGGFTRNEGYLKSLLRDKQGE